MLGRLCRALGRFLMTCVTCFETRGGLAVGRPDLLLLLFRKVGCPFSPGSRLPLHIPAFSVVSSSVGEADGLNKGKACSSRWHHGLS